MPIYYAVARGKKTGIFNTWDEVAPLVLGFPGAVHKKFNSFNEAQQFLNPLLKKMVAQLPIPSQRNVVYTDGSSKQESAGYGMVVTYSNGTRRFLYGKLPSEHTTNNRAELFAIYTACHNIPDPVTIYTDSRYAIGCLSVWTPKWIENNWKGIANRDIIEPCYHLIKDRNIILEHVEAHSGIKDNEIADSLASMGRNCADLLIHEHYF